MAIVFAILWIVMLLLFFGGCVVYAVRPHAGKEFLKRASVLLAVLLIGPSLLRSAMAAIPLWVLILLGAAGSVAAYAYLTHLNGNTSPHRRSPGASHAERHPKLPHHEDPES